MMMTIYKVTNFYKQSSFLVHHAKQYSNKQYSGNLDFGVLYAPAALSNALMSTFA